MLAKEMHLFPKLMKDSDWNENNFSTPLVIEVSKIIQYIEYAPPIVKSSVLKKCMMKDSNSKKENYLN